jgi:alpha-N-arabinofuranosidase|tara:strand:- start:2516 stop:2989 length:474 start_codon:yes stop_codon:yes gene_type:complete
MQKLVLALLLVTTGLFSNTYAQITPDYVNVKDYGAVADGAAWPVIAEENVYLNGAIPLEENSNELQKSYNSDFKIEETPEGVYIEFVMDEEIVKFKNRIVTTEILGKTSISKLPYVQPDNSAYYIDKDYSGKKRNKTNPVAGPFEIKESGKQKIKVW